MVYISVRIFECSGFIVVWIVHFNFTLIVHYHSRPFTVWFKNRPFSRTVHFELFMKIVVFGQNFVLNQSKLETIRQFRCVKWSEKGALTIFTSVHFWIKHRLLLLLQDTVFGHFKSFAIFKQGFFRNKPIFDPILSLFWVSYRQLMK